MLWRPVWTARALDHLLICCSARQTRGTSSSVVCIKVAKFMLSDIALQLKIESSDQNQARTYGFLLKGDDSFTFRPSFLEFLGAVNLREQLGNAQSAQYSWSIMRGTIEGRPPCLAPNSVLASRSARSPSKLGPSIGENNTRDPKCLARSAYRQEMSGPTRSGSAMKSTVYNSRKPHERYHTGK